jgi:hypothetical protein
MHLMKFFLHQSLHFLKWLNCWCDWFSSLELSSLIYTVYGFQSAFSMHFIIFVYRLSWLTYWQNSIINKNYHATAQVVRHYLLTPETWLQSCMTAKEICDRKSGTGDFFSGFPPPNHHSTIAPYPFITAPCSV